MRVRDFIPATLAVAIGSIGTPAQAHDLLRTISPVRGQLGYYWDWGSVQGLDDLDGDGIGELAIARGTDLFQSSTEVRVISPVTGNVLRTITGLACCMEPDSLAPAGDYDGDGIGDLIIQGSVYSPVTGTLLFATAGRVACAIGDVNADGVGDFAIGDSQQMDGTGIAILNGNGFVEVVSGATGSPLWHVAGDSQDDGFGGTLAPAGDFNGDGKGDVLATTHGWTYSTANTANYVRVLSGKNGAQLFNLTLASAWAFQGGPGDGAARVFRDIDGDGVSDVVVGEPSARRARAVSGATGTTLWTRTIQPHVSGIEIGYYYGETVSTVSDADGDGFLDVLVGARQPALHLGGTLQATVPIGTGFVELLSGRTGALLHVFVGSVRGSQFGAFAKGIGDIDGDGRREIAIGAATDGQGGIGLGAQSGGLRLYSGRAGYSSPTDECAGFTPRGAQLPLTIGGLGSTSASAQNFALRATNAIAGSPMRFFYSSQAATNMTRQILPALTYPKGSSLSCLQAPAFALPPLGTVADDGSVTYRLRLGAPNGLFPIGTTWHFQFAQWRNGVLMTSDALALTVTP